MKYLFQYNNTDFGGSKYSFQFRIFTSKAGYQGINYYLGER